MNHNINNSECPSEDEIPMTDDERQLEQLRITRDKELLEMDFLFRIFGKPCFPRGELVAVTGKAKSGKTLFMSMLMSCCVKDRVLQVQRFKDSENEDMQSLPLRFLWYDTEQSEQSTQDILKNRVLRMMGEDNVLEYYDVFNVRCLHYEERLRLFQAAIYKYRPDLVLLDGVRDLLSDINDGVKAQKIVERLMRLAQETCCCLVCVLHQNKGAEDRNLRGWIGTEIMNKAFEVYSCEKVKPENIFVVEQTHTRKYDLDQMLFFCMDADTELPVISSAPSRYAAAGGCPQYASQPKERLPYMNREWLYFDDNNKPHPKCQELFYEALKTGPLYYSDLQAKVMDLLNCGTQLWNNMFCEMRDKCYIVRSKNASGKSVWTLPVSQVAKPQPVQPDIFEAFAAVSGDSPSS